MTATEAAVLTPEAKRARLIEIIKQRSFQTGDEMKLASGRRSTFYFNMKPTMMHPEGSMLIAELFLNAMQSDPPDLVGGLEMGAVPLAASLSTLSHMQGRPLSAFFVRKTTKAHGTQSLIEGLAPGESLKNKKIVVLEDVTTTGGSALKAAELLQAAGAQISQVITIVDRLEGAAETFTTAAISFAALLTVNDFKER